VNADVGREAVYAAEIAAFEGTSYESLTRFDELTPLARQIVDASWWPHGYVSVVPARADAASSSTRQRSGHGPVIRLASPQMTPATLIHEFAHVLAGVMHGHDELFRRAHVDLAAAAFGEIPAGWLLEGYDQMSLHIGSRQWPAPAVESSAAGPVAL